MAEFAALPLFTDSWVADTGHLTRAERGLYLDLLVLIWRSPECRVPNEMEWIERRLRCAEDEKTMLRQIVAEFCQSTGNWLTQKRLQKEFQYVREHSKKMTVLAKRRWNKDKDGSQGNAMQHSLGNAPTPTPTPTIEESCTNTASPSSHDVRESRPKKEAGHYPSDFEAFWTAYPREPTMSKKEAGAAWQKLSPEDRIAAAAAVPAYKSWLGKQRPDHPKVHAVRFLTQRRFEGFVTAATTPAVKVDWSKRMTYARDQKRWSIQQWGPLPHQPGCLVPAELLQPTDGRGWEIIEKSAA